MNSYENIASLIPTLTGWCDVPKAISLYNLVRAAMPKTVVEIGVWGGRSFIPMAMALRDAGLKTSRCVGIDPWDIKASVDGQTTDADRKWWADVNHELVYQNFIYHLKELGLNSYCDVHRAKSDDINPPSVIDVLHLDGNHGAEALRDTERLAAKVAVHGICVLDDLGWSGGFVVKSAEWLLANGFVQLHPLGTGAVYMRMK